jgi:hypothetical protein
MRPSRSNQSHPPVSQANPEPADRPAEASSARIPARRPAASVSIDPPFRPGGGASHLLTNLAGRAQAHLVQLEHRAGASSWVPTSAVLAIETTRKIADAVARVSASALATAPVAVEAGEASTRQRTRAQAADPLRRLAWGYVEHAALLNAQEQYGIAFLAGHDPSEAFKAEWNSQVHPDIWAYHIQTKHQEFLKTVTEMASTDAMRVTREHVAQARDQALANGHNPERAEEVELERQLTPYVLEQTFRGCYANAVRAITENTGPASRQV